MAMSMLQAEEAEHGFDATGNTLVTKCLFKWHEGIWRRSCDDYVAVRYTRLASGLWTKNDSRLLTAQQPRQAGPQSVYVGDGITI